MNKISVDLIISSNANFDNYNHNSIFYYFVDHAIVGYPKLPITFISF